ncbi:MAG: hypothetical protein OXT67_07415 [Zetaproteobacteria bacterium]|nr:hypothetical protein [Zetaproteobacteria bacterium]
MKSLLLSSLLSLFGLSGPPALELSQISLLDQVQGRQGLHQILAQLTEDPNSRLAYLGPDLADQIADHIVASWTLEQNSARLLDAAVQAAQRNQEPNHLLEIVAVEGLLWHDFLRTQEASITSATQLRQHAAATLASFYALHAVATNVARVASSNAIHEAFKETDGHGICQRIYARIYARIQRETLRETYKANWYLEQLSATYLAKEASHNLTDQIRCAPESIAYEALRRSRHATKAQRIAQMATCMRLRHPPQIWAASTKEHAAILGRISYRVAETQAWLALLQAWPQVFALAYQAAHAHLQVHPNGHPWLQYPELFYEQIHHCLVAEVDNPRSRQLLQPLVDELHRIGSHLFPDTIPAASLAPQG